MVDLGINYLHENEECYKLLKKYNIINTIKFPGKTCTFDELEKFLLFAKQNGFKLDFHGIPGMKPAFCCDNRIVVQNIDWNRLEKLFSINNSINRISTHVGIDNKEKLTDYTESRLEENWEKNYISLKEKMENVLGQKIEIGLENIPGEFCFDSATLTPKYVSNNWKRADFGVFDITHAMLSCKTLNMQYEEYLNQLENIDKVKILHIAGDINTTEEMKNQIDKHVMISQDEIANSIKTINKFKNLDLIDSEYVYNTKYSSNKETIIESFIIKTMVETRDEEKCTNVMKYLEQNLKDDISNAEELLQKIVLFNRKEKL